MLQTYRGSSESLDAPDWTRRRPGRDLVFLQTKAELAELVRRMAGFRADTGVSLLTCSVVLKCSHSCVEAIQTPRDPDSLSFDRCISHNYWRVIFSPFPLRFVLLSTFFDVSARSSSEYAAIVLPSEHVSYNCTWSMLHRKSTRSYLVLC